MGVAVRFPHIEHLFSQRNAFMCLHFQVEAAYSLSVLHTKVCARVMFIFGAEQCIFFFLRKILLGMKSLSYQLGVNSVPIRSVYKLVCCGEMKGLGGMWNLPMKNKIRDLCF